MSLVRFDQDGSDVYVYYGDRGAICCNCLLVGKDEWDHVEPEFEPEKMAKHLEEHVAAGHTVPSWAIRWLREPHLEVDSTEVVARSMTGESPMVRFVEDK